jgi:hypothetical protein
MNPNTFWAIVANAMVIGGAVGGGLLTAYIWFTWPEKYRESHSADLQAGQQKTY